MIKNYYKNIIIYDFINKNIIKNFFQIIKINKICINISFKKILVEKEKLLNSVLFLKLITNQKGKITKSKKNNIFLKIKKNAVIGCKITLRKNNVNFFLEKFIFFILPEIDKNLVKKINKNIINFKINNILDFIEVKKEFFRFQNIPSIDISIHLNNNKYNFLLNNYFLSKK